MNKIMDMAMINRSAINTATLHMRDRCASAKKSKLKKDENKGKRLNR
jgi:hypothetical protein